MAMVGGAGGAGEAYDFTKRATRFESCFAEGDSATAKSAVPVTLLPDKVGVSVVVDYVVVVTVGVVVQIAPPLENMMLLRNFRVERFQRSRAPFENLRKSSERCCC